MYALFGWRSDALIKIASDSSSVTFTLLQQDWFNPVPVQLCRISKGQSCIYPQGAQVQAAFDSCFNVLDGLGSRNFSISVDGNGTIKMMAAIFDHFGAGQNVQNSGYLNVGTIPAGYSGGSFFLPVDSGFVDGSTPQGRCFPSDGAGSGG